MGTYKFTIKKMGGEGSGNIGHAGRPGEVGGSGPGGGGGGGGGVKESAYKTARKMLRGTSKFPKLSPEEELMKRHGVSKSEATKIWNKASADAILDPSEESAQDREEIGELRDPKTGKLLKDFPY